MLTKKELSRTAEFLLWSVAAVCLGIALYNSIRSARAQSDALVVVNSWKGIQPVTLDQTLWSPQRVVAHKAAILATGQMEPIAAIRIAALNLEVAVFNGTSEKALDSGAGRVIGTAQIGTEGNVGIAAHRDGYFRSLKDIAVGHEIVVEHPLGKDIYRVTSLQIVDPNDVSVLEQQGSPELTLITCYPFYFVGDAPQRFIVKAERNNQLPNFSN